MAWLKYYLTVDPVNYYSNRNPDPFRTIMTLILTTQQEFLGMRYLWRSLISVDYQPCGLTKLAQLVATAGVCWEYSREKGSEGSAD